MIEFQKMQNCFSKYPKLYNKTNDEKDKTIESDAKQMRHPEARRYQMNEIRKSIHSK